MHTYYLSKELNTSSGYVCRLKYQLFLGMFYYSNIKSIINYSILISGEGKNVTDDLVSQTSHHDMSQVQKGIMTMILWFSVMVTNGWFIGSVQILQHLN